MKYKVKSRFPFWKEDTTDFTCVNEDGKECRIDLFVNGDLPEETKAEDLIGKTVEVENIQPFLFLGSGIRIVEEKNE